MAHPQPRVIEVLDAPAAGNAASVLARLSEREEQRAAQAAQRLAELEVSSDPRESVDAFLDDFAARRQKLQEALNQAASAGTVPRGGGGGDAAALVALAEQVAELEQVVADAAYFLPAYDLRQATLALASLREQQEAAAAALQPRKKFAFNRKASAKAPAATGAAAAAASTFTAVPPGAGGSSSFEAAADELQPGNAAAAAAAAAEPDAKRSNSTQQHAALPAEGQQHGSTSTSSGSGSTISGLRGQVVCVSREEAAGKEFTLSDLEDCTVFLLAPLAALFLHGLRRCKVYTGPVAGACFVEGISESVAMIAARQVRIHAATATDFYLRVRSHPIIEHSSGVQFAPYECAYEGAAEDLEQQGLRQDSGMWAQVNDFGWLRATPSPHWQLLPDGARQAPAPAPPATA